MSLALRVDPDDPTPPYEQLRRQFIALIASGALTAGTRLPPLRQLAADLQLATGTVARTYHELENLDLVRSRRGGGTTITGRPPALSVATRRQRVELALTDAVRQARLWGATNNEIRDQLERSLTELAGPDP